MTYEANYDVRAYLSQLKVIVEEVKKLSDQWHVLEIKDRIVVLKTHQHHLFSSRILRHVLQHGNGQELANINHDLTEALIRLSLKSQTT